MTCKSKQTVLDALLHVSQMISVCLSVWILDRMGYKVAEIQKDVYFQTNHSDVFRQNDSFIEKMCFEVWKVAVQTDHKNTIHDTKVGLSV